MSKEIAQTVGGKRIAWLIAIMAAFAVLATVSTQFRDAKADIPSVTVSCVDNAGATVNPGQTITYICSATVTGTPGGTVTNSRIDITVDSANLGTYTENSVTGPFDLTECSYAAPVVSCVDATGPIDDFTFSFNLAVVPGGDGDVDVASACSITDDGAGSATCDLSSLNVATINGVSGTANTVAAGQPATVTFDIPIGLTYCSDGTGGDARAFTAPDQTVAGMTVQSTTPSTALDTATGTHTVVVIDDATPGGTVAISTHLAGAAAGVGCTTTTVTLTAANFLVPEIRHIPDNVGGTVAPGTNTSTVIARQEIATNVRGSRHTVCTVAQNTGVDAPGGDLLADNPVAAPVLIPGIDLSNIVITNGGGYASTADTDPTFTDVRIFTGDGTATGLPNSSVNAGLLGATCISWVSTDAGDQQINIVYVGLDGVQYNASWDSDNDGNDATGGTTGPVNRSLIKEWNRLEDSLLTIDGVGQGAAQNVAITRSLVLDPSTGNYRIATADEDVDITDVFQGSHTNTAGVNEGQVDLAGVLWTVTNSAGCDADLDGTLTGVTWLDDSGNVVGGPVVDVEAGDCLPGQTTTITFTGQEPGPLGSGTGITVTETVVITFVQNIAEKKVFLAWAGQRIVLEHDWRLLPGDNAPLITGGDNPGGGPTPNGECPFDGAFFVQYIKGGGPGNFLPGLNADVNGSDEAFVIVGASDNSQTLEVLDSSDPDIIEDPQDNCISRVLFESEQPGQVDIEAFVADEFFLRPLQNIDSQTINATKVAFVVYYMKINTINISLASQFEKPSHNNSTSLPDWTTGKTAAPANPWNASLDDADNAVDWNVSKDILVRGRVTGWFLNENPSGRAADTSNPLNVLPANRWVMPNDWPLLAGGPADPADGTDAIGTAEQFRPYYDIMFAPNNARGITLSTPEGAVATQLTFVATGNTGTGSGAATAIRVVSCADLTAGLGTIAVGSTSVGSVVSCSGTSLVVSSPLASAPAAGTGVFLLTTVPFEGPYSTIDIVGLAAQGFGGAALSNFSVGSIRDTALDDGDVDWFDAPMPETHVSVNIRGTGFLKEVLKDEVYYIGTPNNAAAQLYTNPYYITNIPGSPFIPAVVAGGGYLWNSWGNDGPGGNGQGVYRFWQAALIGTNSEGIGEALSAADQLELGLIRTYTGDPSAARDLVVYTDNHGEFMVAANGDFKTDLTACATNVLAGGKHCKPGDKVGTGTISATVDYPDFRGKHFPVLSNAATVNWTWGGYKDVTVEFDPNVDQYAYIVFHAMDRDGFCSPLGTGANLLHSVLGRASAYAGTSDDLDTEFTIANLGGSASAANGGRYNNDPVENVDFLIDSGEGIIVGTSGGTINDGRQFATGVTTFSVAENDPATTGIREFPLSPLAASGQTDECQAWIQVSNSLLGVLNVLAVAKDDEGNIGFDRIIDLTNTTSYTLNFRWSLITWAGADNISVNDALKGTGTGGANPGGNDISASVTAIYGWDAAAQQWLGYFPSGVNVPGANDLTTLRTGQAYWIAITGPSSVTWTIASNVN